MRKTRYKVVIEDETRLVTLKEFRFTRKAMPIMVVAAVVICIVVTFLLIAFTPLRRLVPGYLEEGDRKASIENIMRLDSLREMYVRDRAFLNNLATVLNTDRQPGDSAALMTNPSPMTADSLLPASRIEINFRKEMEQRERYNLSVLAPLTAEGMMFSPVNDECVITNASRESTTAEILLARDNPVCAIADGTVLATFNQGGSDGYSVIIQHQKGFVSRLSRLSTPLVEAGDRVDAGQAISLQQANTGRNSHLITLQIWLNGKSVVPATILQTE